VSSRTRRPPIAEGKQSQKKEKNVKDTHLQNQHARPPEVRARRARGDACPPHYHQHLPITAFKTPKNAPSKTTPYVIQYANREWGSRMPTQGLESVPVSVGRVLAVTLGRLGSPINACVSVFFTKTERSMDEI
jgi:hypothetical protein